ncbi:MAG: RusA family crossover junction endodeoxyribonuclease [bacterium]
MKVELTIPGRPVPAQRMTQKSKWSKRARRSLDYQEKVAWEFKAAAPGTKLEGPLKLTAKFYFADRRHGDLSNLIKAIEDGLQYGQAFENDKQIKKYGEGTGIYFENEERAEVVIEEIKKEE